jgi:hypothetical protein
MLMVAQPARIERSAALDEKRLSALHGKEQFGFGARARYPRKRGLPWRIARSIERRRVA